MLFDVVGQCLAAKGAKVAVGAEGAFGEFLAALVAEEVHCRRGAVGVAAVAGGRMGGLGWLVPEGGGTRDQRIHFSARL